MREHWSKPTDGVSEMEDEGNQREAQLLDQIEQLKDRLARCTDSEEEMQEAQRALRESEGRYRSLVEHAPIPIVVMDRDLKVMFVNRLMPDCKAEDVIGKSIFEHVRTDDPEGVRATIEKVFETGKVGQYQMQGPSFDGGIGTYITTVSPVIKDGEVVAATSVSLEVTKELEAATALRESQERYRMLAASTFEGIVIHEGGQILDVNERIIEMSGYSREDLMGSNFFELLHPDYHDVVMQNVQSGSDSPYEVYAVAKDGSTLELEVQGKEIPYKGKLARVVAVRDIKERKRQEEAHRRSEEHLRLVTESLNDVIWTMDLDLRYTYVSPSIERQRGYTPEEFLEQSIQDVMTPASLEKVFEVVSTVLKPILAGEADPHVNVTLELEMYRKDGSLVLTEMSISLLLDEDDRPAGILGLTRDISERRATEEAMVRSDARYRLFAENADDIIFTMRPDLTLDYVSPSMSKLTGYTLEELVEMGWQGLFTPDSLEEALDVISEDVLGVIEPEKARERAILMELELIKKDGGSLWIEVNVSPVTDESGEVAELLGVARDVTERKRTQEQFMEEKKRAELYLDLFGHDIRNINQGIMSYLELILMRQNLDPEEAEYIKSVLEQATRINDLVAKVQRLTQLRVREIVPEDVDAGRLVHGAIDYVIAKYPGRTIEMRTSPDCNGCIVKGSNMLTDVFISILDNSVRFNRNQTVEVDINCEVTADGGHVRITIEDRGPGISDEMKEKVFKRLDLPEEGTKGSGLGLTVVWEIIKQVHGRIWVEDRVPGEPNKGSRFVIELPRGGEEA